MRILILTIFVFFMVTFQVTYSHEVRPAYLEISQKTPETFDVFWKVPARGKLKFSVKPTLPANCLPTTEKFTIKRSGSYIDSWTVTCPGGISEKTISIYGLSGTITDVLVRIELIDGNSQVARLTPDAPSFQIKTVPNWLQTAGSYLGLGLEHILFGIDHLFFVFVLILLVKNWRQLLAAISAFTVAHSLTLGAATLGYVNIPQKPVEAIIALSIVFVAAELVRSDSNNMSLSRRWPWAIAFLFGLLHGFGFAGALTEIGIPQHAVPLSLLFFNLGVELGQIVFITLVLSLGVLMRSFLNPIPKWTPKFAAYFIGTLAAYWTILRVAGF